MLRPCNQLHQVLTGEPGRGIGIGLQQILAMLHRQISHKADMQHRHGRGHEACLHHGVIIHAGQKCADPLRVAEWVVRCGWRAMLLQVAGNVAQVGHCHAAWRLPEGIEIGGHGMHDRADHHDVAVAEVVVLAPVVIVVLVIAATGDAHLVIHHQQLVVHALIELAPAACGCHGIHRQRQPGAIEHRVVHPQLQVGVQ